MKLILASKSPRRREMFDSLGLEYEALATSVDESYKGKITPSRLVEILSLRKAQAVKATGDDIVIASDTVVALGNRIFGKPSDRHEAYEMMKAGGDGLISVASNAWPKEMKQIVAEKDAMMQQRLSHLIHLLFVEGNPSGIKTVLTEMGLIKNVLRLPMVPCTENTQMVIRRALKH